MEKAGQEDFKLVNKILTDSFLENKSVNYIIKKEKDRILISRLMEYSIKAGLKKGEIFINQEKNTCAILIDPNSKEELSFIESIKFVFNICGIRKVKKVIDKENIVKKILPKDLNIIQLWFIGVEPAFQGKGLGGKFLEEIKKYYKDKKQAICLETSTLKNLPFYKKHGFEIYNQQNFGFDFFFLIYRY